MSDESERTRWSMAGYLRFSGTVAALLAVLVAVALSLSSGRGTGWREAALAACLASGLASLGSGVLLAVRGGTPHSALNRFLIATVLRLLLIGCLAAVFLLGIGVAQGPFLLWLVVSYLALLAVDTFFTVTVFESL